MSPFLNNMITYIATIYKWFSIRLNSKNPPIRALIIKKIVTHIHTLSRMHFLLNNEGCLREAQLF